MIAEGNEAKNLLSKSRRFYFIWSLYFFVLTFLGGIVIYSSNESNTKQITFIDAWLSATSAGVNSGLIPVDMSTFSNSSLAILAILMFLGSGTFMLLPGSPTLVYRSACALSSFSKPIQKNLKEFQYEAHHSDKTRSNMYSECKSSSPSLGRYGYDSDNEEETPAHKKLMAQVDENKADHHSPIFLESKSCSSESYSDSRSSQKTTLNYVPISVNVLCRQALLHQSEISMRYKDMYKSCNRVETRYAGPNQSTLTDPY